MLKSWRRFKNYVKHDLREIVSPSSLEHPPGEGPPEETWGDIWKAFKDGTRDYLDTWKSAPQEEPIKAEDAERPLTEELVGTAKSGAEAVKPILQRLYRTRAEAYRQAINEFVNGYKEGFAGLPDSTEDKAEEKQAQGESLGSRSSTASSAHSPASKESAEKAESRIEADAINVAEQEDNVVVRALPSSRGGLSVPGKDRKTRSQASSRNMQEEDDI